MSDHPWCKDVARDEAVRAAEDAVERPAVPDWRELPERVAALEREVAALRAPVEAEAKAKAETTDGLRTERVTLEITRPHRPNYPASATDFPWPHILREVVCGERESVRVVPAAEGEYFDDLAQVAMERDAAIRERDAALARVKELEAREEVAYVDYVLENLKRERDAAIERRDHLEAANRNLDDGASASFIMLDREKAKVAALEAERDAALARVAELEANQADASRLAYAMTETATDKFAEVRDAVGTLAASARQQPAAEPVAFQVQLFKGCTLTYQDRQAAQDKANAEGGGTVVPLYRSPPPPRGWLTEQEIAAVRFFADWKNGEVRMVEEIEQQRPILDGLLARNAPPKVRLPDLPASRLQWRAILAHAGVEVEE